MCGFPANSRAALDLAVMEKVSPIPSVPQTMIAMNSTPAPVNCTSTLFDLLCNFNAPLITLHMRIEIRDLAVRNRNMGNPVIFKVAD